MGTLTDVRPDNALVAPSTFVRSTMRPTAPRWYAPALIFFKKRVFWGILQNPSAWELPGREGSVQGRGRACGWDPTACGAVGVPTTRDKVTLSSGESSAPKWGHLLGVPARGASPGDAKGQQGCAAPAPRPFGNQRPLERHPQHPWAHRTPSSSETGPCCKVGSARASLLPSPPGYGGSRRQIASAARRLHGYSGRSSTQHRAMGALGRSCQNHLRPLGFL